MYNLWIFNGSANANFYFAVTLAFNTAQVKSLTISCLAANIRDAISLIQKEGILKREKMLTKSYIAHRLCFIISYL